MCLMMVDISVYSFVDVLRVYSVRSLNLLIVVLSKVPAVDSPGFVGGTRVTSGKPVVLAGNNRYS